MSGDPQAEYPAQHGLQERYVATADGTRLRVLLGGNLRGPRLLLVHGFPQNAAEWRRLLPFVEETFRVMLVDLRGYAKSDIPKSGDYSLDTLARDLEAVIDATASEGAPGPVHLAAHDWGGPIAWRLLENRPELVAHFVAVNAPHYAAYTKELLGNRRQFAASWYTLLFQLPGLEHVLGLRGAAALADTLLRSSRKGTFGRDDIELYIGPLRETARLRAALSYYRSGFSRLVGKLTGKEDEQPSIIRVPTIILWGEKDRAIRPDVASRMKRDHVPDAQLRWLPDASHWVPDERPDEVAKALLDGLARSSADNRGIERTGERRAE